MAPRRVHSSSPTTPTSTPSPPTCTGEQRKVFTVWMKSLVFNGHGCTVYDSDGGIVYRVDNYGSSSGGGSVCLMDLHGTIVLNIVKRCMQKFRFGRWQGYRWPGGQTQESTPWFTVTRPFRWRPSSSSSCECEFWCDDTRRVMQYTIAGERRTEKQRWCRIIDATTGLAVAEVKRKTTACGVALGEDVLSLVVEPHADHSLVMGLLLVHRLMNHAM